MAGIISRETAQRIWMAHREIEVGQKLLAEMRETIARDEQATPAERDRQRHLTLGVPSGTGHRLLDVPPTLAIPVIEAHLSEKRRDLALASIAARVEVDNGDAG